MKNVRKKQIFALALSLALTGCTPNEKDTKEIVYIENTANTTVDKEALTNKDIFINFYNGYLERYGAYLSDDQYTVLKTLTKKQTTPSEKEILDTLNSVMNIDFYSEGRGIYRAFNNRLIYEEVSLSNAYRDTIYMYINTLRSVVNNDEEFYTALFSLNIDEFIDCIARNTGIKDKNIIRDLVVQMNAYTDVLALEESLNQKELLDDYEHHICDLISKIISSKLEHYPDFASTLYGELLSDERYYPFLDTYEDLFSNKLHISVFRDYDSYDFTVDASLTYSDYSLAKVKGKKVTEIIKNGIDEENIYEYDATNLMLHLIDYRSFNDLSILTASDKRDVMYDELQDYFIDKEDFDSFFLCIANHSPMTYYEYFFILEKQIQKDGITYDDFVRFTSLSNFLKENQHLFIDWDYSITYPPYEELARMPLKESEKIVRSFSNIDIFNGMDYKTGLIDINNMLTQNDLGYEQLYCPDLRYIHYANGVSCGDTSAYVLSTLIYPTEGIVNGSKVVYYEIPENYENGRAVDSFYNIAREFTVIDVPGLKETFYDESKNREVNGFIVSLDEGLTEDTEYKPIRFMEFYHYYKDKVKDQNKELKLGE